MRVAAVAEIGGDDGLVLALLIGGVLKLIGAGTPTNHGALLNHGEGRVPPVEPFHIGGIGGDVGHGFDMFYKRGGGVLAVTAHLVEYVVGIEVQYAAHNERTDYEPREFDAQFQDNPDANGDDKAEPCSAAEREIQRQCEEDGQGGVEDPMEDVVFGQEETARCDGQEEGQHGPVCGMIVVERAHHPVGVVLVEAAASMFDGGDEHHDGQCRRITVKETYCFGVVPLDEHRQHPETGSGEP